MHGLDGAGRCGRMLSAQNGLGFRRWKAEGGIEAVGHHRHMTGRMTLPFSKFYLASGLKTGQELFGRLRILRPLTGGRLL